MHAEEYEQQFRARVEDAIGPTRLVPAERMPDGRWVGGLYRLKPVWLGMHYGSGRLIGYYVAVSLRERPIECTITGRRRKGDETKARIPTGDRAFDKQFRVTANPPEVVKAVLDDSTRRWMLMVLGDMSPHFQTADGMLRMYSGLLAGRASHDAAHKPVPTLAALTRRIEVTLSLAERMTNAFDKNYAALVLAQRKQLEAAEAEKVVEAAEAAIHKGPTRRVLWLVAVVVLVVVVIVVALLVSR